MFRSIQEADDDLGMERHELAQYLDHTLLKPEATAEQVGLLCEEANELRVAAICVSPSMLPLVEGLLEPGIAICTVVGLCRWRYRNRHGH
jgi:deoxyribose-phosphate aldolase